LRGVLVSATSVGLVSVTFWSDLCSLSVFFAKIAIVDSLPFLQREKSTPAARARGRESRPAIPEGANVR